MEGKFTGTVGIVGCGTMGRCMIESVIRNGYSVVVYDKFQAAAQMAKDLGATIAETPQELAQKARLVIMSLPGPQQILDVVFGDNGLEKSLTDEHIVIDTSTVDPDTSRSVSARLKGVGASYIDSPILGRPSATGKWLLPSGGDEKALEYAKPVLLSFASTVVYAGDSGSGNALKLLNQLMFGCINAISSEVFAICDNLGVEKSVFYDTIAKSSAATVSGLFKEVGKNIVADDFVHPSFTVDLMIKDMKLALQMAKDADAPSIIAGSVQMYNELAHAQGYGGQDTSAVYKVFEKNYIKES